MEPTATGDVNETFGVFYPPTQLLMRSILPMSAWRVGKNVFLLENCVKEMNIRQKIEGKMFPSEKTNSGRKKI